MIYLSRFLFPSIEEEYDFQFSIKLIENSENIMEKVPKHLRPTQEFVLEICKKELVALERELMKLEGKDFQNKLILDN